MTRRLFVAGAAAAATASALPIARSGMGFSPDCFVIARPPRDILEYMKYSAERGAGGVQGYLTSTDADYLGKVRAQKEQLGIYLEITMALPKADTGEFEGLVKAAKEVGAHCLRSVCLSGRRYENFNTQADWQTFVKESHAKLARAVPILEKHRIPLGLENHKDWTVDQMVPLMKEYSSEYLGVCIDWGNNISLLDDPVDVARRLGPFAINSHIKDMSVEEYADGFYLAEVALGEGMLPLKEMLAAIQSARPNVKYSLDMLTRDPLLVPCLTDKYWVTFPDRDGSFLAKTLRMVRSNKPKQPLAWVNRMDHDAALALEQANVRKSVDYSRDILGLRV
jgi:sugar phosphate isomerase/epimerase